MTARWLVIAVLFGHAAGVRADPPTQLPSLACRESHQCTLVPRSCCGECGAPTAADVIAVNTDSLEKVGRPGCGSCPKCKAAPQQLVALCQDKLCTVVKLDQTEMTLCTRDAECATRPSNCCSGPFVALRKDKMDELNARMCRGVSCPANVVHHPRAVCSNGRCAPAR